MINNIFSRIVCVFVITLSAVLSVQAARPTGEFLLWTGSAPGALGSDPEDMPTLKPFYAASSNATGAAMIVCPGGGYSFLSSTLEGDYFAQWLNDRGISAFVLKYRLGPDGYHVPVQRGDAQRAIRYVRANADDWNLDPNRIGIIGASAGGHLAATTMVYFDDGNPASLDPIEHVSCRPDLGILCYPVITMNDPYAHEGSRTNLLGSFADLPVARNNNSCELQVRTNTPPAFLMHTVTDPKVPYQNSTLFAAALESNAVPYELHLYPSGGHGVGLGSTPGNEKNYHPWVSECEHWLYEVGFGLPHLGNIWPLGDSITFGAAVPSWSPGGYRDPLYTTIIARGFDFKFVGSRAENPSTRLTNAGQNKHDGWSGYTIIDIEGRSGLYDQVQDWYASIPEPDIILLMIGINDLNHGWELATAPDRLDLLITRLFELDPDVRLLVSSLTVADQNNTYRGGATNDIDAAVNDYNAAAAANVAARRVLGQNIEFVDMHAGLTLADMSDGLHPSTAGYGKMANIWADAIFVNPPNFTSNAITASEGVVSLSATGALGTSYSLWTSADLASTNWTLMGYNSITTNPFTVLDGATNAHQFYRFSAP